MSKSSKVEFSRINLLDSAEVIHAKIAKAKTDSILEVYSDETRLELTNLMQIYAELKGSTLTDAFQEFKGLRIMEFKAALSESLVTKLAPVREAVDSMLANPDELRRGLAIAKDRSRATASKTLNEVKRAVGLEP